jgi:phage shock protein PspC (stress-responsive transcriptional regulator)
MAYHDPNTQLYRSKDGSVLGGVCSGISERFKIDVSLVRILFLLALFGITIGFWIYVVLWIVLPEKSEVR